MSLYVGIHDAERDHMPNKTFPNLALMKISAYHKILGDVVEWWDPNKIYDKVYSSKVFSFTPENKFLPNNTIRGGTGYGIYNELDPAIDGIFPDYNIYPNCDYAVGFLTRGCTNNCEWCCVPKKEGTIRAYMRWKDIVRSDTKKLVLMDNNILSIEYGISQLEEISATDYRLDINQGMDVRLIDDDICKILSKIKWIRFIRFSCDTKYQLEYFEKLALLFDKYGISKSRVFIYLLVRDDLDDADYRVQYLHNICKNFNVYAQAERKFERGDVPTKLQKEFAQRYVYGRRYKKENWNEYKTRKMLT